MSPRAYDMSRRAKAVERTRHRILDAALDEYAENGIEETSMLAVARRADVAPGTVLYHFPEPDQLAEAVLERSVEDMSPPTARDIDPDAPLPDRIHLLTARLFDVYSRTDREYRAWSKSREHPAMQRWEKWYYRIYGEALMAALGDLAQRPRCVQVVSALIDPGFRANLRQRGLDEDQTVEETVRLVLAWLQTPSDESETRRE